MNLKDVSKLPFISLETSTYFVACWDVGNMGSGLYFDYLVCYSVLKGTIEWLLVTQKYQSPL